MEKFISLMKRKGTPIVALLVTLIYISMALAKDFTTIGMVALILNVALIYLILKARFAYVGENMRTKGLLQRYYIEKEDGSSVDPRAEYFVLRLDDYGTDPKHIRACRKAIVTYAGAIKDHLPVLSEELLKKYHTIKNVG